MERGTISDYTKASYKKSPMLDYFLKETVKEGHFAGLGKDNGT